MYLVFDIGGTNMRIGISSDGKTILRSKIIPTMTDNFDKSMTAFKATAEELAEGEKIEKLSGGIAVIFDENKNIAINSTHLHGWIGKPIKDTLSQMFNVPVILENDTAAVGLGEAVFGSGENYNIVGYIGVGTGVGGLRVVNKKIDYNAFGFEPGHQVIEIGGKLCHCGGKGHAEAYVGGYYIKRDCGKEAKDITDEKIWDDITSHLAVIVCNSIVHWSPDILILGGGIMKGISLDKLKLKVDEYLTIFPKKPKIELAKLGDLSGLYGGLALIS